MQNTKPNRDDYMDGDAGWRQYYDAHYEYENYQSQQLKIERGPTYNNRIELEKLMENQEWNKAVKFAESVKFSDKDKAVLQSILAKIVKENGGYQSQFFYDYGRELLSKTLKSPDKQVAYVASSNQAPPRKLRFVFWLVIIFDCLSVLYYTALIYQVDPNQPLITAILGSLIYFLWWYRKINLIKNKIK